MTADRLREAARVLRERAEEATPGPWRDEYSGRTGPVVMDAASRNALDHVAKCSHFRGRSDAAYIATMHPGVGLLVAELLDESAGHAEFMERVTAEHNAVTGERVTLRRTKADDLADLILGGAK